MLYWLDGWVIISPRQNIYGLSVTYMAGLHRSLRGWARLTNLKNWIQISGQRPKHNHYQCKSPLHPRSPYHQPLYLLSLENRCSTHFHRLKVTCRSQLDLIRKSSVCLNARNGRNILHTDRTEDVRCHSIIRRCREGLITALLQSCHGGVLK